MEKILIRTAGVTGKKIAGYLEKEYEVLGYVDTDLEKKEKIDSVYTLYEALQLCRSEDVKIIIPDKF